MEKDDRIPITKNEAGNALMAGILGALALFTGLAFAVGTTEAFPGESTIILVLFIMAFCGALFFWE